MAGGWQSLLKIVPWRDVMDHAPVVADGAKKLWHSVSGRPVPPVPPVDAGVATVPRPGEPAADPAVAALTAQLAAAQAALGELQREMLASAALLKDVTEQNTGLIDRVERLRKRTLWLAAAVAAALVVSLASVAFSLGY